MTEESTPDEKNLLPKKETLELQEATLEDAKRVFGIGELQQQNDVVSDEINRLSLDDREKYEAVKSLQGGNADDILDVLERHIGEGRAWLLEVRKDVASDNLTAFLEKTIAEDTRNLEQFERLREGIGRAYGVNLLQRNARIIENEREARRRDLASEARKIVLKFHFDDGRSDGLYHAFQEMKKGHPKEVLKYLKAAVSITSSTAAENLDSSMGPPDVEESYRLQAEYMETEELMRSIQEAYGISVKHTPGLAREREGKKVIKKTGN